GHAWEADQSCLVSFAIGIIPAEDVCALVTYISGLEGDALRQFVLDSHVPGIDCRQCLLEVHDARGNAIGQEEPAIRRQRSVGNTALVGRRGQAEEVRECRGTLRERENAAEVRVGGKVLYSKDRQILRHCMTEYGTEYAEVIAAAITCSHDCP